MIYIILFSVVAFVNAIAEKNSRANPEEIK